MNCIGLFKKHGIESTISKEASWAVIRDRLTLGENQALHILSCRSAGDGGSGSTRARNNLTLSARDPMSHQPELKACAVRLRRLTEGTDG